MLINKCKSKDFFLQHTVELGVFVPYPEEGREAKDHLRPSALRRKIKSGKQRTYVR